MPSKVLKLTGEESSRLTVTAVVQLSVGDEHHRSRKTDVKVETPDQLDDVAVEHDEVEEGLHRSSPAFCQDRQRSEPGDSGLTTVVKTELLDLDSGTNVETLYKDCVALFVDSEPTFFNLPEDIVSQDVVKEESFTGETREESSRLTVTAVVQLSVGDERHKSKETDVKVEPPDLPDDVAVKHEVTASDLQCLEEIKEESREIQSSDTEDELRLEFMKEEPAVSTREETSRLTVTTAVQLSVGDELQRSRERDVKVETPDLADDVAVKHKVNASDLQFLKDVKEESEEVQSSDTEDELRLEFMKEESNVSTREESSRLIVNAVVQLSVGDELHRSKETDVKVEPPDPPDDDAVKHDVTASDLQFLEETKAESAEVQSSETEDELRLEFMKEEPNVSTIRYSASDSAVSSLGSERVASPSDGECCDGSDSAQELHTSKICSYGRECVAVPPHQPQNKHHIIRSRSFQSYLVHAVRVHHDHTYNAPLSTLDQPLVDNRNKGVRRRTEGSISDGGSSAASSGRLTRDEKKAKALDIPLEVYDIINLSMDEFNERLSKHHLNEAQLSLIRDIRRRGKNKVASKDCRKRKLDEITSLADELRTLRDRKQRTQKDHSTLLADRKKIKERFVALYRHVFQNLRDPEDRPYSSKYYSLMLAPDGNVLLAPKNLQHQDHSMNRNVR